MARAVLLCPCLIRSFIIMPATTQADPAVAAMLVGMERYNPSNVNPLEAYVDTQCADGSYNLDANLALLKLCGTRRDGMGDSAEGGHVAGLRGARSLTANAHAGSGRGAMARQVPVQPDPDQH